MRYSWNCVRQKKSWDYGMWKVVWPGGIVFRTEPTWGKRSDRSTTYNQQWKVVEYIKINSSQCQVDKDRIYPEFAKCSNGFYLPICDEDGDLFVPVPGQGSKERRQNQSGNYGLWKVVWTGGINLRSKPTWGCRTHESVKSGDTFTVMETITITKDQYIDDKDGDYQDFVQVADGKFLPVRDEDGDLIAPVDCKGSTKRTWNRTRGSCPAGHELVTHNTPNGTYSCDLCAKAVDQGAIMYGCRKCNWDSCESCETAT